MAVVARGAARSSVKPRVQPSVGAASRRAKTSGYSPAKLTAPRRSGLAPSSALAIAGLVVAAAGLAIVVTDAHIRHSVEAVASDVDQLLIAQGLVLNTLTIQGASPEAAADIARASGLQRGQPILHMDLNALRRRIEQVGWVKQASVVRLLPGTLVIAIQQRSTFAVWEHGGRVLVIDDTGRAIPEADPGRFTNLPLVVGDGADQAAPHIMPVLRAHPAVMGRIEALVRVDGRRWDVRMKDGGLIQLPAGGEDAALIRLDVLDQKSRILEFGFDRIDLRDPELIAVRPRVMAPPSQLVANGA